MADPVLRPRSPFDLWHPTGAPVRDVEERSEVVVVDAGVAGGPATVGRTISSAAGRLAKNGLLWLVVPRAWRGRAKREVRRHGLVILGAAIVVPRSVRPAHLIALEPEALRDAAVRHLGLSPIKAAALGRAASSRAGKTLLWRSVPGCALLTARRPVPTPLRWLQPHDGRPTATAAVALGSRPDSAVAVVLRYPDDGSGPDLVLKAALDEEAQDRLHRERGALVTLGPGAARAGARIAMPRPDAPPWALALDVLPGMPASVVLARSPGRLEAVVTAVASWAEAWAMSTATRVTMTRDLLDRTLLEPLAAVERVGAVDPDYGHALRRLATRLDGERLPFTAAHNDLTMANVLIADDGIGIVDWEEAASACLPLGDVWYAMVDALARATRTTPAAALAELLAGTARLPPRLAGTPETIGRALALGPDHTVAGFHACWLRHAANEIRRGVLDGRFLDVVRALSDGTIAWEAWGERLSRASRSS